MELTEILSIHPSQLLAALIERAQYAHNPKLYVKGGVPELSKEGFEGSWLEWFLKETESMHGRFSLTSFASYELILFIR